MKKDYTLTENTAFARLMQLCSRSEKSASDIRKKLKEWGLEAKADQIIKKLVDEKYIDDTRFAAAFAHDKIFINKWGKIKVNYLLKGQQISSDDIHQAFDTIDDQAYRNMIFGELQKKKNSLKNNPAYQIKTKLYAFGIQRGYESELMRQYFESIQL